MQTASYRGVVRGRTIVLANGSELPEGTEVVVTVADDAPGSPAAILRALCEAPQVDHDAVEELRRLIECGRQPMNYANPLLPRDGER
jgi:hypothetical protein